MSARMLLCLLWSLVEQTAPYLTFNDSVIPNHAYVDLSLMMYPGNDDDNADISSTVICHTDLTTCCGGEFTDGDWFSPMELNCQELVLIILIKTLLPQEDGFREFDSNVDLSMVLLDTYHLVYINVVSRQPAVEMMKSLFMWEYMNLEVYT